MTHTEKLVATFRAKRQFLLSFLVTMVTLPGCSIVKCSTMTTAKIVKGGAYITKCARSISGAYF